MDVVSDAFAPADATPAAVPVTFDRLDRLLISIAGVDADVLAQCAARDIGNVRTCASLLLIVWLWQCGLYALVGHMMLARGGEFSPGVLAGAFILATIVLLIDSYVVVRSSWSMQGLAELKKGGLDVPGTLAGRSKAGLFLVLRLLLALVLATLTAVFMSIIIFYKDIESELARQNRASNAALVARAGAEIDRSIARASEEQEELRRLVANAVAEEERLRLTSVEPGVVEPGIAQALDEVAALARARSEAETELAEAQRFASNELSGVKGPGHSGRKGVGTVRKAAEERVRDARERLQRVTRDFEAANERLAALREQTSGSARRKQLAAESRLQDAQAARINLERRLAARETALEHMLARREQAIQAAITADPAFVPRQEGFIAHLDGLQRISAAPHVKFVVIIVELCMLGIDVAAVLAKMFTNIPASYATRIAKEDYLRAINDALEIFEHTETRRMEADARLKAIREPEPPTQPPPEPEAPPMTPHAEDASTPRSFVEPPRRKRGRPKGSYKVRLQPLTPTENELSELEAEVGGEQEDRREAKKGEKDMEGASADRTSVQGQGDSLSGGNAE